MLKRVLTLVIAIALAVALAGWKWNGHTSDKRAGWTWDDGASFAYAAPVARTIHF